MNVIVSNKNKDLLENLGIDVIKEMEGEFGVDELISTFQNFFFQRMILDITAIKNYTNLDNLQKLSISLNMEKIILLLDGTDTTTNPTFISNLVSMGIYNFAKNVEGIQYLYNTPNTYRDVAQFHQIGQTNTVNNQSSNQGPIVQTVYVNNPTPAQSGPIVLGVKNITKQSGATSLVYMMVQILSKKYKCVGIEVDKSDFAYYKKNNLISSITSEIGVIINRNKDKDVIIIDINNSSVAEGFCQEVLYLIEPSIIKLQKLVAINAVALQGLKDKKVVLNKSLLTSSDVANFEYESRLKIFYNLPPLNERLSSLPELEKMLKLLGIEI